jgi:hypothetical protein
MMGSGSSIPTCPKNFDRRDFAAILRLYDKLDTNGDFVVDSHEITQIAEMHARNKLSALQHQEAAEIDKKTLMTEDVQRRLNNEISAIKSSCNSKIQSVTNQRWSELVANQKRIDAKVEELRSESNRYETASVSEKQNLFISAVSKDDKLSFPQFFKYMRKYKDNLEVMYPNFY